MVAWKWELKRVRGLLGNISTWCLNVGNIEKRVSRGQLWWCQWQHVMLSRALLYTLPQFWSWFIYGLKKKKVRINNARNIWQILFILYLFILILLSKNTREEYKECVFFFWIVGIQNLCTITRLLRSKSIQILITRTAGFEC